MPWAIGSFFRYVRLNQPFNKQNARHATEKWRRCLCFVPLSLSLNRARRGGAGDALARALVRAASVTAGARSCASFFFKQMTGSQCRRGKLNCWCPQAYKLLRQIFNQLYKGESSQIGFRQTDGQTDRRTRNF